MKNRRYWLFSAVSGHAFFEIALIIMSSMCTRYLGLTARAAFLSAAQPVRLVSLGVLVIGVVLKLLADKAEKNGCEGRAHALSVAFPAIACVLQGIILLLMFVFPALLISGTRLELYDMTMHGMHGIALVAFISSLIAALIGCISKKTSFLRTAILQGVLYAASVALALFFLISLQMGMASFMFLGLIQAFAVILPTVKFAPSAPADAEGKPKSKVVAAVLAFMLGPTGAHRYYLGYLQSGLVQSCGFIAAAVGYSLYFTGLFTGDLAPMAASIVLMLFGGAIGVWAFVDFIRILTESLRPASGQPYSDSPRSSEAPAPDEPLRMLEKLAELHEKGVLTDEEFAQKKAQVLEKL